MTDTPDIELVLGAKVRALREERGWTQAYLAERLAALGVEMHQTTVAKMEAGRRPLRVSEALAVATAFGMPLSVLLELPVPGGPVLDIAEMQALMQDRTTALVEIEQLARDAVAMAKRLTALRTAKLKQTAVAMASRAAGVRSPIVALAEGDYCVIRDDVDGWTGVAEVVNGSLWLIGSDDEVDPDSDHVHILRRVRLVDYDTGEEVSA